MNKKMTLDALKVQSFVTLSGKTLRAGAAAPLAQETANTVKCCPND